MRIDRLTPTERRVLIYLAMGLDDRQIAIATNKNRNAIRKHLTNIYQKLGASGKTAATMIAIQNGLVDLEDAFLGVVGKLRKDGGFLYY